MMEDASVWVVGVAALTAAVSFAVRRWLRPPLPPFIMGEWTGPQILRALGPLDPGGVSDLFARDMTRRGQDPAAAAQGLPRPGSRHRVAVQALCTQLGLAVMYAWLGQQFAPFGYIPCHDSHTHTLEVSGETVRHTLRYRLQRPRGGDSESDAPAEAWKVDFLVRFCARRQELRHAKVLAVPQRR